MRSRANIEADRRLVSAPTADHNTHDILKLEVLLDIRKVLQDILAK